MRSADRAWGEALVRFGSVVNPENGLDDDQVDYFRSRLLGSLDDLAEQIAGVAAERSGGASPTADVVDPAVADRVAAHEIEVEAVSSALVAIDAGVYGICLRCHRPIGFQALADEPVARTCSACA